MAGENVVSLRFAQEWLEAERLAGETYGPELLALPIREWRPGMKRNTNFRRYGTLKYALDQIHNDILQAPARARERAEVIVGFAEHVDAPLEQQRIGLAGLAWREYASALTWVGLFSEATDAAKRSLEFLTKHGSFACDAAKTRLVEALIHRELGNKSIALEMTRACAAVFQLHADAEAYVKARMAESVVLNDSQRYRESMEILLETAEVAERRGDRHTLAICLHNTANCARALGDHETARNLDARSLKLFDQLGATAHRPFIRWTYAMSIASEGHIDAAISELYVAQADLLALGMNSKAAAFGLDILNLRHERGDDVQLTASQLVEQFTRAGMLQSAIEALAYLRGEAERGTISTTKIRYVREFILEVPKNPGQLFVLPPYDFEESGA
jgi:tetratricopeptide (TPR) repeat protein